MSAQRGAWIGRYIRYGRRRGRGHGVLFYRYIRYICYIRYDQGVLFCGTRDSYATDAALHRVHNLLHPALGVPLAQRRAIDLRDDTDAPRDRRRFRLGTRHACVT